jgi:hypothetical protein
MSSIIACFINYQTLDHPKYIYIDDDGQLNAIGIYLVTIKLWTSHVVIIDHVLHAFKLTKNLLFVNQIISKGTNEIMFSYGLCTIHPPFKLANKLF